jgi:hypothetical protein
MNPTCKDCGKEMRCGDCKYWVTEKGMPDGECRAKIPQILLMPMPTKIGLTPGLTINGFFPRTRPDLWCGEFIRLMVVGESTVVPIGINLDTTDGKFPHTEIIEPDDGAEGACY